ncbi:MAG TPA: tetratricopeptide repeat protein, partial [Spirochaetota bacterium]|nr:tetratricopeptide repeat protein [Spirochaetota bacterium]
VKGKSQPTKVYEVLSMYPDDAVALFTSTMEQFQKALTLYNKKQYTEALHIFKEIALKNPCDMITKNFIEDMEEKKD